MARNDGNGWVHCRCGSRHWGVHGAAGLALLRPGDTESEILVQLRAGWTHQGGTWGLPGGARDSHESVEHAALREAAEEAAVDAAELDVVGHRLGVDHGDWSYTYVIATARSGLRARVTTEETDRLAWVGLAAVDALSLHPGLRSSWQDLQPHLLAVRCAGALPDRPGGSG